MKQSHDEIVLWLDEHCLEVVRELLPNKWSEEDRVQWAVGSTADVPEFIPPEVVGKTWERPVIQDSYRVDHRIHGYIDLYCTVMVYRLSDDGRWFRHEESIAFEVKPKIESAGEVIRQLRRYQTYMRGTRFAVVSPDGRFAKLFREQGFYFVLAPGATASLF